MTAPETLIRDAIAADAAGIARAHVQSWRESYGGIVPDAHLAAMDVDERTKRWLDTFQGAEAPWRAFVAVSGVSGAVQGFVTVGKAREGVAGLDGELYALYLLKEAQGTGAGRRLFDAARQSLRSCGISGMYLWVLADNPSSGFYRHMGGREVARKTIDIGGKPLEEIAYGWPE